MNASEFDPHASSLLDDVRDYSECHRRGWTILAKAYAKIITLKLDRLTILWREDRA